MAARSRGHGSQVKLAWCHPTSSSLGSLHRHYSRLFFRGHGGVAAMSMGHGSQVEATWRCPSTAASAEVKAATVRAPSVAASAARCVIACAPTRVGKDQPPPSWDPIPSPRGD
uniref:Uncharacterized protein n=1 Tax=Oryza punctata TaxID=4537 RepID=A0A0E0K4H5_ORYPU